MGGGGAPPPRQPGPVPERRSYCSPSPCAPRATAPAGKGSHRRSRRRLTARRAKQYPLRQALSTIPPQDRKSTRLNSSHSQISYAVFCLKKKKTSRSETASPELSAADTVNIV